MTWALVGNPGPPGPGGGQERNADLRYWVDGVLRHRDEPGISPFDSVVQGGDAAALGFLGVPSDAEITAAIVETLRANGMRDGVHVRLTLTRGVKVTSGMDPRLNERGCTLIVLAEHKAPVYETTGLRLVTASTRRPGPDVLDPKVHHNNLLNSILAKMEATAAGADDALMLDGRGFVAETNATHLFAVSGGTLHTPRTVACPEGITRQTVLDLAAEHGIEAVVRDISPTEMYTADEVFCTGTMGEIAGVTRIDDRVIGDGRVGPVTGRVAALYRSYTSTTGTPVVP